MSDLIERQAAKEAYCKKFCHPGVLCPDSGFCREVDEAFDPVPSAQPEIIRCKDCENWIPGYITDNDDFIPPKCGKYQQMVGHSSDDYCSHAERRTDG